MVDLTRTHLRVWEEMRLMKITKYLISEECGRWYVCVAGGVCGRWYVCVAGGVCVAGVCVYGK